MNRLVRYGSLALIVITFFGGCGGSGNSTSQGSPNKNGIVTQSVKKEETMQQKALQDTSVPREYRNALKKGISYATRMHMSKARVYHQLTSQYGEKFSQEAAQWAISHMSDIDWKKEAAIKGKSYYEKMNMSKQAVYDQLCSEHGEMFTQEEAAYAVSQLN
jgi:hypothetical protein